MKVFVTVPSDHGMCCVRKAVDGDVKNEDIFHGMVMDLPETQAKMLIAIFEAADAADDIVQGLFDTEKYRRLEIRNESWKLSACIPAD